MTLTEIVQYYNLTLGSVIILLVMDWVLAIDVFGKKLDAVLEDLNDFFQGCLIMAFILQLVAYIILFIHFFSKDEVSFNLFNGFSTASLGCASFVVICLVLYHVGIGLRSYCLKSKNKR